MNGKTLGYWATTGLLSLALFGSAAGKLSGAEPLVQSMEHLGYPTYLMNILGVWYLGAAIALLAPGLARVKEWAYAGIVFAMSGAFASHLFVGDGLAMSAPTLVLAALAVASYLLKDARGSVAGRQPAMSLT